MQVTVDRHSLPLLPTLDCSDITVEVGRDFLPGIQALFERLRRSGVAGRTSPIAYSYCWLGLSPAAEL